MTQIEAIQLTTTPYVQEQDEFSEILNKMEGLVGVEAVGTEDEQEGSIGDAEIADMIVANGVINNVIRQIKEDENKLKEILDDV